jgi:hypothetical protein
MCIDMNHVLICLGGRAKSVDACRRHAEEVDTIESLTVSQGPMVVDQPVDVGCDVDVRTRYVGSWSNGFEVAEHVHQGCLIRRHSDGSVLPDVFRWSEIRPSVRRRPTPVTI